MEIVTGDRYLEKLVKFVEEHAGALLDGTKVLKLNPAGLWYVQSRLEALLELERLLAGAPVDYLRAYVSDLGDHRAIEQLRRILRLLTSLKVVSSLPRPIRDPTPVALLPFGRLRVLELRGCDLSTSAAKGLLELRHTLEKIICHNSTDALRHVFASRISEIKDSPQWNRLSFVSCACNRLVLMDESLQLLPAVETLDLSRNKFAKVDNLRKCTKLRHLDLGFNNLRTISYFNEVSSHIVKLVLRNNALTTLRGIENLKSLEGLDISYNIISNFSELEFLVGFESLRSLWLEGNPLSCARWYRSQVFSYFVYPDKLKLDDKEMSTKEFWQRQIIIASRHKRPASFGFYSPATDDAEGEESANRKKKKASRLAAIASDEESTYFCSDQESGSCDNEIQSKEENAKSDDEAEIVDLIKRVERLKKERSVLWLREFKDWMDHPSENCVEINNNHLAAHTENENYMKNKKSQRYHGESSRNMSVFVQASGDDGSTNILESDNPFEDKKTGFHSHHGTDHNHLVGATGGIFLPGVWRMDLKDEHQPPYLPEGNSTLFIQGKNSHPNTFTMEDQRMVENEIVSQLTARDDITESHSSSAYPGSPPHYQEDILHRRHNLVEEILQLSAESFSVASSDSNTSCSEDDLCESEQSCIEDHQSLNQECSNRCMKQHLSSGFPGDNSLELGDEIPGSRENGAILLDSQFEQTSNSAKTLNPGQSLHFCNNDLSNNARDGELAPFVDQEGDWLEKKKKRRKPKKRVVSLLEEHNIFPNSEASEKPNGNLTGAADAEDERGKEFFDRSDCPMVIDKKHVCANMVTTHLIGNADKFSGTNFSFPVRDDVIEDYFRKNVADSRNHETCILCMCCGCVLEPQYMYEEREVALILSSENKFYVLLLGVALDGSGALLSLFGWHKVEDIRDILVGLRLQILRMYIEGDSTYLLITRNVEKSLELLHTLQSFDSQAADKFSLRSLEQVQVELFEKQICEGLKQSLFQYSMVLFWCSCGEDGSWLARSLFVIGGHVVVCDEDFMLFSSLQMDAFSSPYFSLDSCCSIGDVSEMIIEGRENTCLILALERATSEFCPSTKAHKHIAGPLTWKLKLFSEESLFKFVALLKAIHAGTTESSLLVRCVD